MPNLVSNVLLPYSVFKSPSVLFGAPAWAASWGTVFLWFKLSDCSSHTSLPFLNLILPWTYGPFVQWDSATFRKSSPATNLEAFSSRSQSTCSRAKWVCCRNRQYGWVRSQDFVCPKFSLFRLPTFLAFPNSCAASKVTAESFLLLVDSRLKIQLCWRKVCSS